MLFATGLYFTYKYCPEDKSNVISFFDIPPTDPRYSLSFNSEMLLYKVSDVYTSQTIAILPLSNPLTKSGYILYVPASIISPSYSSISTAQQ